MLGRRRLSSGCATCSTCSSLLGRLDAGSKSPLFKVFIRLMTFSPALLTGLLGSAFKTSGNFSSCREPARDEPRSLGVCRPLLEPGRLPAPSPNGNGGKAQSRFAEYSGLGGRGSHSRGIGLVILLSGAVGRPPLLLPDLELAAGEIGDSGLGNGARKGLFAASGLIFGKGARGILDAGD